MAADRYRSGTTPGGKPGCLIACLSVFPALFAGFFYFLPFGDCPPAARCHDDEGWRMMAVILSALIIAACNGYIIRKIVNYIVRRRG